MNTILTMATKTKRARIYPGNTRPPADIREKTKERRAWLEQRLKEITAQGAVEARVIGKGSYEEIAVWQLTEIEGRLRYRGHCQYCGHSQVVKNDVLVLHGYTRPGDGYIFNECPGMSREPLEQSEHYTRNMLLYTQRQALTAKIVLDLCESSYLEKMRVVYGAADSLADDGIGAEQRQEAIRYKPTFAKYNSQKATPEEQQRYDAALTVWAEKYPEYAAYVKAGNALQRAKQSKWQADAQVRHFEQLLAYKYLGQPLKKEVVV